MSSKPPLDRAAVLEYIRRHPNDTEFAGAFDEWLRLDRIQQGIHERLRRHIEFIRSRVDQEPDPVKRAEMIAITAQFDIEDE
jgi:hypothetical protein